MNEHLMTLNYSFFLKDGWKKMEEGYSGVLVGDCLQVRRNNCVYTPSGLCNPCMSAAVDRGILVEDLKRRGLTVYPEMPMFKDAALRVGFWGERSLGIIGLGRKWDMVYCQNHWSKVEELSLILKRQRRLPEAEALERLFELKGRPLMGSGRVIDHRVLTKNGLPLEFKSKRNK